MTAQRQPSREPVHELDGLGAPGTPGRPTGFSCPRCGGVLGEEPDPPELRLACRTGHVLTLEALDSAQDAAIEDALWAAVRALEEKAAFSRRLFERAQRQHDDREAERHRRQSSASERRAAVVRELLRAPEIGTRPKEA